MQSPLNVSPLLSHSFAVCVENQCEEGFCIGMCRSKRTLQNIQINRFIFYQSGVISESEINQDLMKYPASNIRIGK